MEIITQNYENMIKDIIINNFSQIIKENITRNDDKNRVFNYIDILSNLDSKLCEIARNSLIAIFNALDRGFKNSPERRHRYHIKSHQQRTILTIFGEITIRRTFYVNKYGLNKSSYCYLDDYLGLKKYDYFDPYIKAEILELVSQYSYGMCAKQINKLLENRINLDVPFQFISKQTVRNIVMNSLVSKEETKELDTPETLYVMADEKFIATQNNNNEDVMVKSIVVFDGIEIKGKRRILKNKKIFASFDTNPVHDALDYVFYTYDMDKLKNIFIMGDGASWIKNLRQHFVTNNTTNVVYALDKFHFKQALHHICLHDNLEKIMTHYILNNNSSSFNEVCELLIKSSPHRKETIIEKQKYISINLNYILNLYENELSCPMESQISHNISALFASRPKAYSKKSLKKLLLLRLLEKNNENIKNLYFNNHNKKELLTINQEVLRDRVFDYKNEETKLLSSKAYFALKLIS